MMVSFRSQLPAAALLALSSAFGCSLVVDASREQCATTLDCQIRGLAFEEALCVDHLCQPDPTWACVDSIEAPAAQAAVEASVQVTNLLDQTPFVGVQATLYSALDISLSTPLSTNATDAQGRALLSVPAGFDGFVLIEQADVVERSFFYPTFPITAAAGMGTAFIARPGASAGLVGLIGEVPQAGRGIALIAVRDCNGSGGSGASLTFSGETQGSTPFYAFNGVASSSARTLDQTGQAGIVNVRPGVVGMEVRWGDKTVSSASVLIAEDSVTQLTMLAGTRTAGVGNLLDMTN